MLNRKWLRLDLVLLVLLVFARLFLTDLGHDFGARWSPFNVPSRGFPGGDAISIRASAYCARQGAPYYAPKGTPGARTACLRQVGTPPLVYPSIWPRLYGLLDRYNVDPFFTLFWEVNAALLMAGLGLCALALGVRAFPFILFAPAVLLAVERGDCEATVFFFTFMPTILLRGRWAQGLGLGLASGLGLFPLFAAAAHLRDPPARVFRWDFLIGLLAASPLVVVSLLDGLKIVGAGEGFAGAYGLVTLKSAPWIAGGEWPILLLQAGYVAAGALLVWTLGRSVRVCTDADSLIGDLDDRERMALGYALSIFLFTFLFLMNWSYRLLFVTPALMVLARKRSALARIVSAIILAILWLPMVPGGWGWQNLACYALAPLAAFLMTRILLSSSASRPKPEPALERPTA